MPRPLKKFRGSSAWRRGPRYWHGADEEDGDEYEDQGPAQRPQRIEAELRQAYARYVAKENAKHQSLPPMMQRLATIAFLGVMGIACLQLYMGLTHHRDEGQVAQAQYAAYRSAAKKLREEQGAPPAPPPPPEDIYAAPPAPLHPQDGAAQVAAMLQAEAQTTSVPGQGRNALRSKLSARFEQNATTATVCGSAIIGYANSRIHTGMDLTNVMSHSQCKDRCSERESCSCWSWKEDGYCRVGNADSCTYSGSPDDERWKFGLCDHTGKGLPVSKGSPAGARVPHEGAGYSRTCRSAADVAAAASNATAPFVIPIVIITHARAEYLTRALESVFQARPNTATFPVTASQDGDDKGVDEVCKKYLKSGKLQDHIRYTAPSELKNAPKGKQAMRKSYQKLAAHYKWALDQMLVERDNQQLIILEEDLEVAPDFFDYFGATLPLLQADPCLFCVSAWNDNGKSEVASDASAIFRTDFFPGLGWMMLGTFWREVRDRWPLEYWDDWMRRGDIRQGRHCLRPEVPRTHTFGEIGVSKGQFYKAHLQKMVLNSQHVNWKEEDLSSVASVERFQEVLTQQIREAKKITLEQLKALDESEPSPRLVVQYPEAAWVRYAKPFGLMEDVKDHVRRGAYRGVLPFTWRKHRVFLVLSWPLS